jgi:hypothetical protein
MSESFFRSFVTSHGGQECPLSQILLTMDCSRDLFLAQAFYAQDLYAFSLAQAFYAWVESGSNF